jgi:hypothetical protein
MACAKAFLRTPTQHPRTGKVCWTRELGRLYCTAKALWKLDWFLRHFLKVKWGEKCPVCKCHDELKDELDSLLSLKA